jgi:iron complex outermembrane receptor protein
MTQPKLVRSAIVIAIASLASMAQAQSEQDGTLREDATTAPTWAPDRVVIAARRANYTASEISAARRMDTTLIKIPQSVQVLTRTLIEEQDRRTLGEALVNVSGVVPTRSEEQLLIPPPIRDQNGRPELR